jgi:hypothetical protein
MPAGQPGQLRGHVTGIERVRQLRLVPVEGIDPAAA